MRNIIAAFCVIALLPTGVFAQDSGEPPALPAVSPRSRPIAAAVATLRFLPSVERNESDPAGDDVSGVTVRASLGTVSLTPQIAADQEPNKVSDWSRLQALQHGTEITLTVKGRPAAKVVLLVVSDSAVFVASPTRPALPGRVTRALIDIGDQWPRIFSGDATYAETNGVRVSQDGIFDGNQKVAALALVVQRVPREDVSELRGPGKRKGNKLLAGAGVAAGLLLATFVGLSMADKYCGSSCTDEKALMGLAAFGLPTALGLLGYYGGGHTVPGTIYRPPPAADAGLARAVR